MVKPTKAQTWGAATILSIPVAGIMTAFVIWVAGETVHIEPIIATQKKQTIALERIGDVLADMRENDLVAQKVDAIAHAKINNSVNILSTRVVSLTDIVDENTEECEKHIKEGQHK